MLSPKLIVFDLDGTLIEFHHDYLLTEAERILPHLDHPPVARGELAEHFSDFDFFRFAPIEGREEFIRRFWSHFDWSSFPAPRPFPHSLPVLVELTARDIPCAIATARIDPVNELWNSLQPTGLLPFISQMVTRPGDHVDWMDKRGHIRELSEHFGIPAADMLLVGDIPSDISSAKAAGVGTTIAVCSGGIKQHVLEQAKPDFVLPDISHILPLIQGI